MPLKKGSTLGPYTIDGVAGTGGMGEVYRAHDSRLDRTVAIKVLPQAVADNEDVRQRFEREAKAVSSLSHPNICTLYDVGNADGVEYLVMEYIEGQTLADRLKGGRLDLSDALSIAIQVATGLDAAHRTGLVHRDLKPGNIMLTKDGAKLLDFGLAKYETEGGMIDTRTAVTRTTPLTGEGTIVGTLQYMSPEQLEGKEVDRRTDIFSFGAVLYEMMVGDPPFGGESNASLIASILKEKPRQINELKSISPAALHRTILQCLEKDPDRRWQTAGDLKRELQWIADSGGDIGHTATGDSIGVPRKQRSLLWGVGVAAVALAILAFAIGILIGKPDEQVPETRRFEITTEQLQSNFIRSPRISPNGRYVLYHGAGNIWVRDLSQLDSRRIEAVPDSGATFWAPDSRSFAYDYNGKIWRYDLSSNSKSLLCDIPESERIIGGAWSHSGTIMLAVWRGGLYSLPEQGGSPSLVISADSALIHDFHSPSFLPDGKALLATVHAKSETNDAVILVRDGDTKFTVVDGGINDASAVIYAPSGHLIYTVQESTGSFEEAGSVIWAQPFSLDRLKTTGEPFIVAVDAQFPSVARNGTMVYTVGKQSEFVTQPAIVSRLDDNIEPIGDRVRGLWQPQFSADGRSVLFSDNVDGNHDIWRFDLIRKAASRITSHRLSEYLGSWFPGSSRIVFHRRYGVALGDIFTMDAATYEILDSLGEGMSPALTKDEQYVLYTTDVRGDYNIWYRTCRQPSEAFPLLVTENNEDGPVPAPNGKWFAYYSDETGANEVYIRRFPEGTLPIQISVDGGKAPFWHPGGDTLFFPHNDSVLYKVGIEWDDIPVPGPPISETIGPGLVIRYRSLWGWPTIDISPDASKFVVGLPQEDENAGLRLVLVENWLAEFEVRE